MRAAIQTVTNAPGSIADGGADLTIDTGVGVEIDGSFVQSNVQNGVFTSELTIVAALPLSYSGEILDNTRVMNNRYFHAQTTCTTRSQPNGCANTTKAVRSGGKW